MSRARMALFAVLGALVLAGGAGAGGAATGGADAGAPPAGAETTPAPTEQAATGDLNTCAGLVRDDGRACYSRELAAIVNGAGDPLAAVEGITQAAYADQSGFLL